MPRWVVRFHPASDVEVRSLPAELQARMLRIAALLETFGPQQVGMPHVRPLQDKLWEMRMQGRDGIARAIYVAMQRQTLVVLHVFMKKSQQTPLAAIAQARRRLEDLA